MGDVNVYLLQPARPGEQLTLVDTGPHWEPSETALRAGLAELGHSPADLGQIIITHPHPDHYGLASKLAAESGAAVLAHPNASPTLESGRNNSQLAVAFYLAWFAQCGVPAEVQEQIAAARDSTHHYARPVAVNADLCDGDPLRLGGQDWQVLTTPGHSGGLICLWQPDSRVLLANDHLIAQISSNPVVEPPAAGGAERPKRLLQYLEQLERVAALRPVIAYSGHGDPITDVAGLVQRRIAFHHQRADQVWEQLGRQPHTVFDLTRQLFPPTLPSVHLFLALSEVQGHLDMLEASGRASCHANGPVCRWTAAI